MDAVELMLQLHIDIYVEDGLIEGLESPEHSWVIGFQCHPERQDEVPQLFGNLFLGLKERAETFISEFAA